MIKGDCLKNMTEDTGGGGEKNVFLMLGDQAEEPVNQISK